MLAGLYARQAWDLRDYPLAATHAATAAQIALEGKNTSAWWNMTYMQAECLIKQGNWQECQNIMQHLLEHPMATESAGLGVRARQMLAAHLPRAGPAEPPPSSTPWRPWNCAPSCPRDPP